MNSLNWMTLRRIISASILLGLSGAVQALPINVFSTGVDAAGAVVAGGTVGDLHYSLISAPPGVGTGIKAATSGSEGFPIGPWLGDNTLSRWIGPNTGDLNGPVGSYTYRTTFDLTGLDLSTAALSGRWATDNPGTEILINDVATGLTAGGFTAWSAFSINSGFVAGLNTLDFVVYNAGGPTGLRVEISGDAAAAAVPEPASLVLLALGLAAWLGFSRRKPA